MLCKLDFELLVGAHDFVIQPTQAVVVSLLDLSHANLVMVAEDLVFLGENLFKLLLLAPRLVDAESELLIEGYGELLMCVLDHSEVELAVGRKNLILIKTNALQVIA